MSTRSKVITSAVAAAGALTAFLAWKWRTQVFTAFAD